MQGCDALFVLASGITIVQIVANPLISLLGPAKTAHSRLTFAQAFNALGTTVFPYFGSILILGSLATVDPTTLSGAALDAYRAAETHTVVTTYLGLAVALLVVAAVVWTRRNRLQEQQDQTGSILHAFDTADGKELWKLPLGNAQKAPPVMADGKIYVGTDGGKFFIVRPGADKGEILSSVELPNSVASCCGSVAISRTQSETSVTT